MVIIQPKQNIGTLWKNISRDPRVIIHAKFVRECLQFYGIYIKICIEVHIRNSLRISHEKGVA